MAAIIQRKCCAKRQCWNLQVNVYAQLVPCVHYHTFVPKTTLSNHRLQMSKAHLYSFPIDDDIIWVSRAFNTIFIWLICFLLCPFDVAFDVMTGCMWRHLCKNSTWQPLNWRANANLKTWTLDTFLNMILRLSVIFIYYKNPSLILRKQTWIYEIYCTLKSEIW